MKHLGILFDLDGTLTDSGLGITRCAQLALAHFGIEVEDLSTLGCFVGPPLRETFPRFGLGEDQVEEAIAVFRGRYQTVGKFENQPYPGISHLLTRLTAAGASLYVATSKPEETALEILKKFQLDHFFTQICGADFAGLRETKDAVIGAVLETLPPDKTPVMVGDTVYDVKGAAVWGIPTIGVSWGYGSTEEMEAAGAIRIVRDWETLFDALRRF